MIAFTVDEACAFKKGIAQEKEFKKEYPTFRVITNLFRLWFIVLTSIKALFVATIIVSSGKRCTVRAVATFSMRLRAAARVLVNLAPLGT